MNDNIGELSQSSSNGLEMDQLQNITCKSCFCDNFIPNPWKPNICSNCFHNHATGTSGLSTINQVKLPFYQVDENSSVKRRSAQLKNPKSPLNMKKNGNILNNHSNSVILENSDIEVTDSPSEKKANYIKRRRSVDYSQKSPVTSPTADLNNSIPNSPLFSPTVPHMSPKTSLLDFYSTSGILAAPSKQLERLQASYQRLTEEHKEIINQLEAMRLKLEELEAENQRLTKQDQINSFYSKQELEERKSEVQTLKRELQEEKKRIQQLKSQLEIETMKRMSTRKELEKERSEKDQYKSELDTVKENYLKNLQEITSKLESAQNKAKIKESELEALTKYKQEIEKEKKNLLEAQRKDFLVEKEQTLRLQKNLEEEREELSKVRSNMELEKRAYEKELESERENVFLLKQKLEEEKLLYTQTLENEHKTIAELKTQLASFKKSDTQNVRYAVVNKLLSSEKTYIQNLVKVIQLFMHPMRGLPESKFIPKIFCNIEELLFINIKLGYDLESRVNIWSNTQIVGDLFINSERSYTSYLNYMKNCHVALTTIIELKEKKNFSSWLNKIHQHPEYEGVDLILFVLLPVQRLIQYHHLLKEMLKSTEETHPDFQLLTNFLKSFESIAVLAQENIKKEENFLNLVRVRKSFVGNENVVQSIVSDKRQFIREGWLKKVSSNGADKQRYFFLFSDLLIYASPAISKGIIHSALSNSPNRDLEKRFIFQQSITLDTVHIKSLDDTPTVKNAFQVFVENKSFTVYAATAVEKEYWLNDFKQIAPVLSSELNYPTRLDSSTNGCMICKKLFNATQQKNHCRLCGQIVCSNCITSKSKNHCICSNCHNIKKNNSDDSIGSEKERVLITVITPEALIYVSGRFKWSIERLFTEIQKKKKVEEGVEYELYLPCGKRLFAPMKHDQTLSYYETGKNPEVVFLSKALLKTKGSRLYLSKTNLKTFSEQSKEKLLSLTARTIPSEDTPKRKFLRPKSQVKSDASKIREEIEKAILEKQVDQVKQILERIDGDDVDSKSQLEKLDSVNGQAAIHSAIRSNNSSIIELFLEFYNRIGGDVNIKDRYGWTILHHGVSIASGTPSDEETLKILLKSELILVNVQNDDKNTPLHYFCQKFVHPSCQELGSILIKKAPESINKVNRAGETPLHKAIFNNAVRVLMVKLLISKGADVNIPTTYGETALHYAVRLERKDLLKVLLQGGADPTIKDSQNNKTPYEIALQLNQPKIAFFLKNVHELLAWLKDFKIDKECFLLFLKAELFLDVLANTDDQFLESIYKQISSNAKQFLEMGLIQLREQSLNRSFDDKVQKASIKPVASNFNAMDENRAQLLKESLTNLHSGGDWHIMQSSLEFTKELGSGKFSTVFKGLYKGQKVAIKVLNDQSQNEELEREFKKEFQVMSLLNHSNIIKFLGACLNPRICIVMEYCSRGSLYDVLNKIDLELTWERILKFSIDAVSAVKFLHTYDPPIVHRDIKSLNFLIRKNWDALLGDMGLARLQTSDNVDTMRKMRGTYLYSAPELFKESSYTDRCDIYSLGIVFWELLSRLLRKTYRSPFSEYPNLKIPFQIFFHAATKNLRPTIPHNCPSPLKDIVQRCWDSNPEIRPSAIALLEELTKIRQDYNQKYKKEWNDLLLA